MRWVRLYRSTNDRLMSGEGRGVSVRNIRPLNYGERSVKRNGLGHQADKYGFFAGFAHQGG